MLGSQFTPDISAAAISRSGIVAAAEMGARLGVDGAHVITGHTHRAGPEAGEAEWPLPGGGRLHNTGSWIFASAFHHPGTPPGPYWPGTVTWLEDERAAAPRPAAAGATARRAGGAGQPSHSAMIAPISGPASSWRKWEASAIARGGGSG